MEFPSILSRIAQFSVQEEESWVILVLYLIENCYKRSPPYSRRKRIILLLASKPLIHWGLNSSPLPPPPF